METTILLTRGKPCLLGSCPNGLIVYKGNLALKTSLGVFKLSAGKSSLETLEPDFLVLPEDLVAPVTFSW